MRRREINYVVKKGKPGNVKVAVAYPSVYEVAVSSLAYQMMYFYINSLSDFVAERFNLERLRGEEPPPLSLERNSRLKDFDIVMFSVHYEPDYVNIVRMLEAGGVEPLSQRRDRPLVVAGGPPLMANPLPLSGIADVVIVGEIEPTLPALLERYLEYRGHKRALLESLEPERGFYVPEQGPEEVRAVYAGRLTMDFHPVAQIQPLDSRAPLARATMVEASRGCGRLCRFCMEGYLLFPMRERALDQVVEIAVEGSKYNRTDRAVLYSLSFFDHSEADEILERLLDEGLSVSVPSLRLETLNSQRLELMASGGQKTLTLAPETASPLLGSAIGKPLDEDRLVGIATEAKRAGFRSLKLYYMVGLPGEGTGDIERIADFLRELSSRSRFRGVRELKLAVTPFIPKPQTPMQWLGMEDVPTLRRKIRVLKRGLGGIAEVREYDPGWARAQAALARSGASAHRLLIAWARAGGGIGGWRRALKTLGVKEDDLVGPLDPEREPPWSIVRTGTSHVLPREGRVLEEFLRRGGLRSDRHRQASEPLKAKKK